MNNKIILSLIIAIIVVIAVVIGVIIYRNSITNSNIENEGSELVTDINNDDAKNNETKENESKNTNSKTLVAYYSAQTHTKAVAENIANNLNANIFEIVPKDVYTSEDLDWTDSNSRVTKEHENESLRNIELVSTKVDNWDNYDTILIGYPIWWGVAAWPVDTFVKENNFDGKTVIPFCTSMSSGLGESGKLLEQKASSGKWLEGHRFNSNPSENDIKEFIESLK